MIKIPFSIVLVLLFASTAYAQTDYCDCFLSYYKAEKAYYNDQRDSVWYYYEKAFANPRFGGVSEHFNAADRLMRIGEIDRAKKLLMDSAIKGSTMDGINGFIARYPDSTNLIIDSSELDFGPPPWDSLDHFLISELKMIEYRDQAIRTEYEDAYSDKHKKKIDYGNFLLIKNILDRYDGSFPDRRLIGLEGEEYLKTVLHHFEIEWIAEIFPALVEAIHKGYRFNHVLIYQIDRNIVDSGKVYVFDEETGSLIQSEATQHLGNSILYHQLYGGFDISVSKIRSLVWWPFDEGEPRKEVNILRKKLCLDTLEDYFLRRPYIQFVTDSEFLNFIGM